MFDYENWCQVIEKIKPLYKCHKNDISKEADKVIKNLLLLKEENPNNENIIKYVDRFIPNCLLAQKNYSAYISLTEPMQNKNQSNTHTSNRRLELCFQENIPINPLDVLSMAGSRKSIVINENFELYKDQFIRLFNEQYSTNEKCLNFLYRKKEVHDSWFFEGLVFFDEPTLMNRRFNIFKIRERCFYSNKEVLIEIRNMAKEAENRARKILKIPLIGQGWITESNIFNLVKNSFPQIVVIQHGNPTWLGRQHLDIWMPEYNIAVEYHGRQHYEPIEFFGGEDGFIKTQERDRRKIALCKEHGVKLIVINEESDLSLLISKIQSLIKK
jgi:hypothetical protein